MALFYLKSPLPTKLKQSQRVAPGKALFRAALAKQTGCMRIYGVVGPAPAWAALTGALGRATGAGSACWRTDPRLQDGIEPRVGCEP